MNDERPAPLGLSVWPRLLGVFWRRYVIDLYEAEVPHKYRREMFEEPMRRSQVEVRFLVFRFRDQPFFLLTRLEMIDMGLGFLDSARLDEAQRPRA